MSDLEYLSGMTTETPAAAGNGSGRKSRGPAVPTINLEKAIGLMRKVWEKEKRNSAPVASIVTHWGYKPKSSGGFLAIASLKRFGLLDEQGSNEKRTLKLSGLALSLLKNETTDIELFQQFLKNAALTPKFHQEMWTKYGTELPSDQTIESFLVFDKQFSEDTAKAFIREYKETIGFAKLTERDTVPETEGGDEAELQNEDDPNDQAASASRLKNRKPPMNAAIQPGELPIPLDGERVARVPFPMSEDTFDLLISTLQLWKKKLVTNPKPEDESAD